jgi:hypothetical protein
VWVGGEVGGFAGLGVGVEEEGQAGIFLWGVLEGGFWQVLEGAGGGSGGGRGW